MALAIFDLRNINGKNGVRFSGAEPLGKYSREDSLLGSSLFGHRIGGPGDVNGDGIDDLSVLALGGNFFRDNLQRDVGRAYVIFGKNDWQADGIDISDFNETDGFSFYALDSRQMSSINVLGDINGDGFDDVVVGTGTGWSEYSTGFYNTGVAHILFGNDSGFPIDLDFFDVEQNRRLEVYSNLGSSVRNLATRVEPLGDINGDEVDDFVIFSPDSDNPTSASPFERFIGAAYVIYGKKDGFSPGFNVDSLDGDNGFTIYGNASQSIKFDTISSAGDINGDGVNDIIFGSSRLGKSYIVYGKKGRRSSVLDLVALNADNGFEVVLKENGRLYGGDGIYPVSSAGDFNSDGIDDIIIGNPGKQFYLTDKGLGGSFSLGEAYIIFGDKNRTSSSLKAEELDGNNGFILRGDDTVTNRFEGDLNFGGQVKGVGDINGDGVDDLVIDSAPENSNVGGKSYVLFGREGSFAPTVKINDLSNSDGYKIIGHLNPSIRHLNGVGDFNNDGINDFALGFREVRDRKGEVVVIFGQKTSSTVPSKNLASIVWNTQTSKVYSMSIDVISATASLKLIDRTITDTDWALQTVGDMDGDGQSDVLLRHARSGQHLVWYLGSGGQSIKSESLIGRNVSDSNWSIAGTGDMNADGDVDIIMRNQAADQIVAWYMDGAGNTLSERLVGRGFGDNNWKIEAMADFNGDGKADILLRNALAGQNLLWEMDGATILAESKFGRDIPDVNWNIEGASDFDNNGTVDVLMRNAGAGQALLWSMADKSTIGSEILIANVPGADSQIVF